MVNFYKWTASNEQLFGLDLAKARDLVVECFYTAQKDKFQALKEKAGIPSSEKDVYDSITVMVRLAFVEVEGDFQQPTKEKLLKVVDFLNAREVMWGTPRDVVEHNKAQMLKVVNKLR
jgi:hypothetical protein